MKTALGQDKERYVEEMFLADGHGRKKLLHITTRLRG